MIGLPDYKKERLLMNLQIRLIALEEFSFKLPSAETALEKLKVSDTYKKALDYPNPQKLYCPRCGHTLFKAGSTADEHDTYLILMCEKKSCDFQYSPSHSSP